MWELYDELIASVEPGVRLRDAAVGAEWTAVLTEDGGLGIAPTIREEFRRFSMEVKPEPGMDLIELAPAVKSWNYYEAALGLAAVSAFHNRPERIPETAEHHPGRRRSLSAFVKFCRENLGGKHSLLVEPLYLREDLASAPGIFDIARRVTTYRDYPVTAYRDLVPACEQLILSGVPLVDKYGEPILAMAERCRTRLWGIDIPLADVFRHYHADELTGFLPEDPEKCFWRIKTGADRDDILKMGHFVTVQLT